MNQIVFYESYLFFTSICCIVLTPCSTIQLSQTLNTTLFNEFQLVAQFLTNYKINVVSVR